MLIDTGKLGELVMQIFTGFILLCVAGMVFCVFMTYIEFAMLAAILGIFFKSFKT